MAKKRIVVVCPGRGSYTKDNLQSLKNRKGMSLDLQHMDERRRELGWPSITELDSAEKFKTSLHTKGEHASPLIYACAKADFLEINQEKYEIVAVAGNSMGWYLTLAFSQALDHKDSYHLIQTMGSMMKEGLIGGQIIYPVVDENWNTDSDSLSLIDSVLSEVNALDGAHAYVSIHLGGYKVLAGNKKAITELMQRLPKKEHYPFQLVNHGAFHTPLLKEISQTAEHSLYQLKFKKPLFPMIDGRGHIWQCESSDPKLIYDYTLKHQVLEPYDFSSSIQVALKEFAPDHLVLLGPGNSLGGAIGQIMIDCQWRGVRNKDEFSRLQKSTPFLLSMGLPDQARILSQ